MGIFVFIQQGKLRIEPGDHMPKVFELNDVDGPAQFLLDYVREFDSGQNCGASCDIPEEYGAPKGYIFHDHWSQILKKHYSLIPNNELYEALKLLCSEQLIHYTIVDAAIDELRKRENKPVYNTREPTHEERLNQICQALGYPGDTDVEVLVNHILSLRHEARSNIPELK